jgi:hypothetical protein
MRPHFSLQKDGDYLSQCFTVSLGSIYRTIFFIDNVNKDTEKIYTIIKPMDNSEEDEDIV